MGSALVVLGLVTIIRPSLLARRFAHPFVVAPNFEQAVTRFAIAIGVVLVCVGGVTLALRWVRSRNLASWLGVIGCVAAYLALTSCLSDWLIDDAAITFAYSENLVRGYGLTLHPALPPEEGYSDPLWMLWLAALRALGVDIPLAAKVTCVVLGAATCALVHRAIFRLRPIADTDAWLVPTAVVLGAPFLIWSVSGLEHGLQALAILAASVAPAFTQRYVWITAASLTVLTLIRPEAPLLVMACFGVHSWDVMRDHSGWRAWTRTWPIAIVPALAWATLMLFRLIYFGDAFPNPYYAKATDATLASLLNPVGRGWEYVTAWAFGSAIVISLPAIVRAWTSPVPLVVRLCVAAVAAQLLFVIPAQGDWMGGWRFIAPILPTIAVVVAWAYQAPQLIPEARASDRSRVVLAYLTAAILSWAGAKQYVAFLAEPATPYAVVAHIGEQFVSLGHRLGLAEPLLAHHDAGGTSYKAGIKLLDLGGLGSRTIAKHMDDAEFLTRHILYEAAPDFVFGAADTFAAARFSHRPEFAELYVPLEFPGEPLMKAQLCHVKRSLLVGRPAPDGIELETEQGVLTKVIVH